MYVGGKLLRVERTEEATINSGLTLAEANQLAADCYADPGVFNELQIICGIQYTEREVLERELVTVQDQKQVLEHNKMSYETIRLMSDSTDIAKPHDRSFVLKAAQTSAAQALREMKDDVQKQAESMYASAAIFSAEMAMLCVERLRGAPLLIMGRQFDYEGGYLTTNVADGNDQVTVLFGPIAELRAQERSLQQREQSFHEKAKIKVVAARLQDWAHVIQALKLVEQF